MNLEKFLNLVADPGGIVLCYTKENIQPDEKSNPNRAEHFTDAQSLIARAAILSSQGCDLYFTPARFATRSRNKTAAKGATSVWVDVDVRDNKGFATHEAALAGIHQFCAAASLPEPTIVATGSGYHCYWTSYDFLKPAEWTVCAKALHSLVKQYGGLMASDTARITDIASMMRLPGFMNHKRGSLADVMSFAPVIPAEEFKRLFSARDTLLATLVAPTLGVMPSFLAQSSAAPAPAAPAPVPSALGAMPAFLTGKKATATVPGASLGDMPDFLRTRAAAPGPALAQPNGAPAVFGGLATPVLPPAAPRKLANPITIQPIAAPSYAQLLANCAVIRDMAESPDNISEPAWKMALNTVVRTEEGIAAAHEFSRGYAGYSHEETQAKAEAADEFGKPVTCATLIGVHNRAYLCSSCPRHNKGFTPLRGAASVQLVAAGESALDTVAMTTEAINIANTPAKPGSDWSIIPLSPVNNMLDPSIKLPVPPIGYIFGHLAIGQAGVFATGELSKPVISDLLWVDRLIEWVSEAGARKVGYRVNHMGTDGNTRAIYIPGDALDKRNIPKWLLNHGVTADVTDELTKYVLAACQAALRAKQPPLYVVSSYGWYILGGKRVFISPTAVITEDGAELEIKVDGGGNSVLEVVKPDNPSLPSWCEGYRHQFLADDYHAHFFVLVSLSSVMFKMMESDRQINGTVVVMSGESGVGKSHTNAVCASVWGRWEPAAGNSTVNALPKEAASRRHLPVFIDDLTIPPSKEARAEVKNAIMHYTLGKEKSRLTSASKLDVPAVWRNVLFISTNVDITSMLQGTDNGDAAVMRTIEVRMPTSTRVKVNAPHMNAARAATRSNFGVLGNEFIHRLMRLSEEEVIAMNQKASDMVDAKLAEAGVAQYKIQMMRMRLQLVAMCYVTATIMQDALPYDMTDTLQWAVDSLAGGEFALGLQRTTTPHHKLRVLMAVNQMITSRQAAVFQWVAPHPDSVKVTLPMINDEVEDYDKVYDTMNEKIQVTPQEFARLHNQQLAVRTPSVDIIQAMDWAGRPQGFLLKYDMLNNPKMNHTGLSARAMIEVLGAPADGVERVWKIDMHQVTPGKLRGVKARYVYITPDEANHTGDEDD